MKTIAPHISGRFSQTFTMINEHHTFAPLLKGVSGMIASFSGVYISYMAHIEAFLRVAGVALGCACGIASLVSIVRNMPPRKKGRLP